MLSSSFYYSFSPLLPAIAARREFATYILSKWDGIFNVFWQVKEAFDQEEQEKREMEEKDSKKKKKAKDGDRPETPLADYIRKKTKIIRRDF